MPRITVPLCVRLLVGLAAAWAMLPFGGCSDRAETRMNEGASPKEARWVRVSRVEALPPRGRVEYVGVLSALMKANVACETGGTIEKLHFEKGDRVEKGQLLAEISTSSVRLQVRQAEAARDAAKVQLEKLERGSRPEEIRIARAGAREAEAGLAEAERNFERIKDLYRIAAVPDSDYDTAKRALATARERLESAKETLALAEAGPRMEDIESARANFKQAEAVVAVAGDRLRKSRLLAPCDGIIAFREVEEGEVLVIPPAVTLTQVVNLERLKVRIAVGEKDIGILARESRFSFTVDALPGETFSCRVTFVSPVADPATRAFPVEFLVDEPDPRMADGMTARVSLPLLNEKKTIKVPTAWLSEEDGKMGLYVAEDGKARFRVVDLGAYYDQRVEILSGVSDHELVITNPSGLKGSDPVRYE